MKTSRSSAFWTVAMAATALSVPSLMKRGDSSGFFLCIANSLQKGEWVCSTEVLKIDIGIVSKVEVKPLTIELNPPGGAPFSISSTNLQANVLQPPSPFPAWPLTHSRERATLEFKGGDIATFVTAMSPTKVEGSKVLTDFPRTDLAIVVGEEAGFSKFIAELLETPAVDFRLKGTLDATLKAMGGFPPKLTDFNIEGLAFNSPITLVGCNSFQGIKFSKLVSFTQDPKSKNFVLTADVTIDNKSDLVLKLGDLRFETRDSANITIGTTVFKDFSLKKGPNEVRATTTTNVPNPDELLKVLTKDSVFKFWGYKNSSDSTILANGLLDFKVEVVIPALPGPSTP
ncbi:hypothetical protein BGZ68_004937 [Mortierella alpina]|nr:hypothetical protein BGZ68_004937 [Mortierella alpina]